MKQPLGFLQPQLPKMRVGISGVSEGEIGSVAGSIRTGRTNHVAARDHSLSGRLERGGGMGIVRAAPGGQHTDVFGKGVGIGGSALEA